MKKLGILLTICLCMAIPATAQKKPAPTLEQVLQQIEDSLQEPNPYLKSYYLQRQTAALCEAWATCAKYAFDHYTQDQSFRVVKALEKKVRVLRRHSVAWEVHLFIQTQQQDSITNLVFTQPVSHPRTTAYRIIRRFPQE